MLRTLVLAAALAAAPLALAHSPAGTPKDYCESPWDWYEHDYGPTADGVFLFFFMNGNVSGDCNADGVPGDHDGHSEYAKGGAWLLVDGGEDGRSSGTWYCFGEAPHHPYFGPVHVVDVAFFGVPFFVGADYDYGQFGCGDGVEDRTVQCFGTCLVPFVPGIDGAYHVFVEFGSQGHVYSP